MLGNTNSNTQTHNSMYGKIVEFSRQQKGREEFRRLERGVRGSQEGEGDIVEKDTLVGWQTGFLLFSSQKPTQITNTHTVTYTLYKILCPVFKQSSPPPRTTPLPLHTTPRASGAPLVTDWIRSVTWSCQNWPWATGYTLTTWEHTQCQPSPPSMAFWDPRRTTTSARPIGTPFHYPLVSRVKGVGWHKTDCWVMTP